MEDQLLFLSVRGRLDLVEEASVQRWRRSSSENERRYQEVAQVLGAMRHAEDVVDSTPPSILKLVHRAESRNSPAFPSDVEDGRRQRLMGLRRAWSSPRWGVALVVVLVLPLVIAKSQMPRSLSDGFAIEEFATGPNESATVTLGEGSVVRLGPQSRLRLTKGTGREVSLSGLALFAVASDPERPFRITTAGGSVEVLGTRFEMEAYEDDLRVAVIEGRVALSWKGRRTEVPAGEMGRVVGGVTLPVTRIPPGTRNPEWAGNFIAFQETPLGDAVAEIQRLYDVQVEISDPALARHTVTGWFSDQTPEYVMTIVCMVVEAECTTDEENDWITIEPKRDP